MDLVAALIKRLDEATPEGLKSKFSGDQRRCDQSGPNASITFASADGPPGVTTTDQFT